MLGRIWSNRSVVCASVACSDRAAGMGDQTYIIVFRVHSCRTVQYFAYSAMAATPSDCHPSHLHALQSGLVLTIFQKVFFSTILCTVDGRCRSPRSSGLAVGAFARTVHTEI